MIHNSIFISWWDLELKFFVKALLKCMMSVIEEINSDFISHPVPYLMGSSGAGESSAMLAFIFRFSLCPSFPSSASLGEELSFRTPFPDCPTLLWLTEDKNGALGKGCASLFSLLFLCFDGVSFSSKILLWNNPSISQLRTQVSTNHHFLTPAGQSLLFLISSFSYSVFL